MSQGMFETNMLAFNPGWNQSAQNVDLFDDVSAIKEKMVAAGHVIEHEQGGEEGPANFVVVDPDGNPILIEQHR